MTVLNKISVQIIQIYSTDFCVILKNKEKANVHKLSLKLL